MRARVIPKPAGTATKEDHKKQWAKEKHDKENKYGVMVMAAGIPPDFAILPRLLASYTCQKGAAGVGWADVYMWTHAHAICVVY